ncbi:MAG TPA: DEAD/DEAH box helicase, partial [Alphaproteobacteria bacterium]|nr:DEAD/DEAH box helicase [Alphaproteobacteria bacterium]
DFIARFPYQETEDQERAIADVLRDLESGHPMDRLICGDVGFGKTEVAMRAAWVMARSGRQVAVVVPTTLLARQHYQNFTARFSGTGLRVEQISRLVPAREAARVRNGLANGSVRIVVGTHALLGREVRFADLGLLVVDEEQHFGVRQKERLKEIKENVHVLTLSATPIPRTLQMALSGVRELSLIATPPVDRLAVRTFVLPHDPVVIREALMREHHRGGQSFYVCPRIKDLPELEARIRDLVPEIRVVSAHGQMAPTDLEDRMTAFYDGQYDLLLATNIIESGIDIPRANTMIVHRADLFGLSQLYQLRGRIGRARLRAYAYLTWPAGAKLNANAHKRLEVIETLDTLGAGFQLASHDLDIRGAGNMLGEAQTGHIREVGVELYQQMLEEAVAAARQGASGPAAPPEDRWSPVVNLGVSVLIPEFYVTDLDLRMGLYRRLGDLENPEAVEGFAAELIDRFGALPPEVETLLDVVRIRELCRRAAIARIDAGPKGALIGFHKDRPAAAPERLLRWIADQRGVVRLRPDQKLVVVREWPNASERLKGARDFVTRIAALS